MIQTLPPKWGGLPSRCVSLRGYRRIGAQEVVIIVVVKLIILRASPRAAGPTALRRKKRGIIAAVVVVVAVYAVLVVVVTVVVVDAVVEYIIILIIIIVVLIDFAELQLCQTVHLESSLFFKPLVFPRKVMARQIDLLCCWLVFLWPAG